LNSPVHALRDNAQAWSPYPREVFDQLKAALAAGGLRGAVAFLNALTSARFTSLYRFSGGALQNITFYDRQNPEVDGCEEIPVEASYCVYIRDYSASFSMPDSNADERVRNHPKRQTVQSYCGVPLLDGRDQLIGSICHFDLEPGRTTDQDVELLEYMARLLQPAF
jgi:GAF domain-containing protein